MATDAEEQSSNLDDNLRCRVDSKELEIFKKKSLRVTGKPYQMLLREMIASFNEGNLRIIATEELGELYVTGK
jgi:predicted DNA binding CopG/RHH family protein